MSLFLRPARPLFDSTPSNSSCLKNSRLRSLSLGRACCPGFSGADCGQGQGLKPGSEEGWPCNVSGAALAVSLSPRQVPPSARKLRAVIHAGSAGPFSAAHRSPSLSLEVMEMAEEAAALLDRLAAGLATAPSGGSPALSSSDGSGRPAAWEERPCCWSLREGKEKRNGRDSSGGGHERQPALRPASFPCFCVTNPAPQCWLLPLSWPAEFSAGVRIQGRVKTPPPPNGIRHSQPRLCYCSPPLLFLR